MISGGVSWQLHPRWRVVGQGDWIDWSGAFDVLHVKVRNGNSSDLNGLVGSDGMDDFAPLDRRDQYVFRTGLEFTATGNLRLRGGYSHGRSPVPSRTLTPPTAAIMERTLTTGAGWEAGRWFADFAYQYDLPVSQTVATSGLQAGEYSRSATRLSIHWLGLTTGFRF